jgi:hypothetical protein
LHTISWGRQEDIPHSDCVVSRRLAQRLGADHRFYKLTAQEIIDDFQKFIFLGEGLTDFPESFDVFHRIKEQQGIDIVLRGDHYFASASWQKVHDEHTMFLSIYLKALSHMDVYQRTLKPHYYQRFCELDEETIRRVSSRCTDKNIFNRRNFFYTDVRTKYYFGPLNYVKNFAMESFEPLFDYDLFDLVRTLPVKYRLAKSLWRKTVADTFPELSEEIAKVYNMIDWAASFKGSPALKSFVYRELVQDCGILQEFIDTKRLKAELDAFFSTDPGAQGLATRVKAGALKTLEKSTAVYRVVHGGTYYARKATGRVVDMLPPEWLILRLLILKAWCDVFLNYPVASTE